MILNNLIFFIPATAAAGIAMNLGYYGLSLIIFMWFLVYLARFGTPTDKP